jgi:secreted Zn-dependent insulinase-like peptidase
MTIDFWNKYYTSDNITISIISNLSIKKQKDIVKNTFGLIEKKKSKEFILSKPLFNIKNKTIQLIPITDKKVIKFYWEIPAFGFTFNN